MEKKKDCLERIFKDLCETTKTRLTKFMQIKELSTGESLNLTDKIQPDFVYVSKGKLKVVFE